MARQDRSGHIHRPEIVDLHQPLENFRGKLLDVSGLGNAG